MEPTETREHFIRCTLTKDKDTIFIDVPIPSERFEEFYDASIEFDIIRRVTLVEERSLSELQKDK